MPTNMLRRRDLLTVAGTVVAAVTGGAIVRNTDVRADSAPARNGGGASVLYTHPAFLATTDGDTGPFSVRGVSTIWVNILATAGTPTNPNSNTNTVIFQLDYFDALGNALPTPASGTISVAPGQPFPQYAQLAAGPATAGYAAPLPNSVRVRWVLSGSSVTFSISVMGR